MRLLFAALAAALLLGAIAYVLRSLESAMLFPAPPGPHAEPVLGAGVEHDWLTASGGRIEAFLLRPEPARDTPAPLVIPRTATAGSSTPLSEFEGPSGPGRRGAAGRVSGLRTLGRHALRSFRPARIRCGIRLGRCAAGHRFPSRGRLRPLARWRRHPARSRASARSRR
jgi:hypothetical protein